MSNAPIACTTRLTRLGTMKIATLYSDAGGGRSQCGGKKVYHASMHRTRASDERICMSLNSDRRFRTVSGMHNRVIRKAEEHIFDRRQKHLQISAGQVGP